MKKIRHNGSVVSIAILLAYGITSNGKKEALGASASLSEARSALERIFKAVAGKRAHKVR